MFYYLIALFEGFTTLSIEILSLRHAVSIIGSNIVATSIFLGVILIALSYGYYQGGKIAGRTSSGNIAMRIAINLFIASCRYLLIAFPLENILLQVLLTAFNTYFVALVLTALILFFFPVFLTSQTVPLLSELLPSPKKSEIMGKLLFFSTLGSFLGSILTSLVLFTTLGVIKTIIINGIILFGLCTIIVWKHKVTMKQELFYRISMGSTILCITLLFLPFSAYIFTSDQTFSASSPYADIAIYNDNNNTLLSLNGNYSSIIDTTTKKSTFSYIQKAITIVKQTQASSILVLGGAGMTFPQQVANFDFVKKVVVCEIDYTLTPIVEKYFLQESLNTKITVLHQPARYCLQQYTNKQFDLTFVDVYTSKMSVPPQLLTQEFYQQIDKATNGTILFNFVFDKALTSKLFHITMNTLSQVRNNIFIQHIKNKGNYNNVLVSNKEFLDFSRQIATNNKIYLDDHNTIPFDQFALFYQ